MVKAHVPAITGGLKIRIWDALRIEAQKRGLPVAGLVRRVFHQAMQRADFPATPDSRRSPSPGRKHDVLPGLLQDQLDKS